MKDFFKGVIVALVTMAVLGIICFSLARTPFKTTLSPQEEALKVIRVDIPESENAFTYFLMVTNMNFLSYDYYDIETMMEKEDWDTNMISQIIETNESCFSAIEAGTACTKCLIPEESYMPHLLLDANNYYAPAKNFRQTARLMSIKVRLLFRTGKEKEAFSLALLIVKMGHMIEDCGGDSVFYVTGLSIKNIGWERIEEMVATTTLPSEDLIYYAKLLAQYPSNHDALKNSICVDYQTRVKIIDDLSKGQIDNCSFSGISRLPKVLSYMSQFSYFFQPKKTKQMLAEMYAAFNQNIPNNVSNIENSEISKIIEKLKQDRSKSLFTPNGLGKLLCEWLAPNSYIIGRKCMNDLFLNANRTLLALKAYKTDHDKFPETLEHLTPDYLDKVPADTYDGKPIRYSQEKSMLYSVGDDLKDSGGSEKNREDNARTNRWRTEDIVFKIGF